MFYVGQKVVCVDASQRGREWNEMDGLCEGEIYTIRWVGVDRQRRGLEPPQLSIYLSEIVRPVDAKFADEGEVPYLAVRFRPAVERKTDISIFTAMLNPSTEKVTA